jgi:hypothetical protein
MAPDLIVFDTRDAQPVHIAVVTHPVFGELPSISYQDVQHQAKKGKAQEDK